MDDTMHEELKGRVRSIVTRSISIMNNIMGFMAGENLEGFDSLVDDVYGQKIADLYTAVLEGKLGVSEAQSTEDTKEKGKPL